MAPAPEEQWIESLAFQCLEAADRHAALARVAAEHPQLVERVRRLVDRVAANESLLSPELVQEATAATPAPAQPMELPRPFGRFQLLECLGMGGMGAVYRARDTQLGRDVALKLIRSDQPAAANARFEREAAAASRLDHPNLCKVYETGLHEGTPFLVMQLVTGTTLQHRIHAATHGTDTVLPGLRRGTAGAPWLPAGADLPRILNFFATLADALHHAHERGLVHRDVKPGNIMVSAEGAPMVLDFGLVRDDESGEHSLTRTGAVLGSPNYMAPEQILPGLAPLDRRADVYSLGVSLFQALTLRMPFDAPSLMALRELIVQQAPPRARTLNPAIGHDLQVVLDTALEKRPDWRFCTAAAFAADLRAIVERRPIAARPVAAPVRAWRWVQRNPIAAALLTTLVAGLTVSSWLFTEAEAARAATSVQLARFDRLATVVTLKGVSAKQDSLWPARPVMVEALQAWLDNDCSPLLAQRPQIEATIAELRSKTLPSTTNGSDHPSGSRQFLHDALVDVLAGLDSLAANEMVDVEKRLSWARQVQAASLAHPKAHHTWAEAREAIAKADDVVASKLYAGTAIPLADAAVIGLVPIGMNPATRLWEFYDLRSAWDGVQKATDIDIPRHQEDGAIQVAAGTGIVFVLLPGGLVTIGTQKDDPDAPHFDPEHRHDEGLHEVSLAPFFLARHEMTQGQWARLWTWDTELREPSVYKAGSRVAGKPITLANPVEHVDWSMCDRLLSRYDLVLPTEAQWEYGCRGGTQSIWNVDFGQLKNVANLAEEAARAAAPQWGSFELWHDGHAVHAPVGTFAANALGLFDVHGNVWEWCRDEYGDHGKERNGDGMICGGTSDLRCGRGGSFLNGAISARSAGRLSDSPSIRTYAWGLRPARLITN